MKQPMSFIRRFLPKNHFVRSVSLLVGGTVGGQLVMVIAAPVLTRLYAPQDFGLLAVFVALLSLVSVVACLRYELSIPLPDNDREAAALAMLSLLSAIAFTALSTVPLWVYRHQLALLMNTPALADYLYLVPLGALFAGVYSILNFWAIRVKAFGPLAKTKLTQSLAATGIQIGGAALGPIALLVGQVVSHAMGSVSLSLHVMRLQGTQARSVTWADIHLVARKYKGAPLFSTWSALFNTSGSQLPPILFAALFSPAAAGIYALANRVLAVPIQVLGKATSHVFFSNAAQAHREGKLHDLVMSVHGRLAHVGMPPTLVLIIAGPDIFSWVFGAEWRQAGVFARYLAPWLYLVLVTSPLTSLFELLDRQAIGMVYQGVLLTVRVTSIFAGAWIGDALTAVLLFALGNIACSLANLTWIIRVSGNSWYDIWRPTLSALGWSLVLVSPMIAGAMWDIGQSYWISALAAASLLIAMRYTYLMKSAW